MDSGIVRFINQLAHRLRGRRSRRSTQVQESLPLILSEMSTWGGSCARNAWSKVLRRTTSEDPLDPSDPRSDRVYPSKRIQGMGASSESSS